MQLPDFITLIFWSLAFSCVFIFLVISSLVYTRTKQRVFFWYALYCFLVLCYLLPKPPVHFPWLDQLTNHTIFSALNWYIQIAYLSAYLMFGCYFVGLEKTFPLKIHRVFIYQKIMFSLSTLVFLGCILKVAPIDFYFRYFLYFFLPIHLIVVFYLFYLMIKDKDSSKKYFLWGSVVYLVLAVTAFYKTLQWHYGSNIQPIVYFYWALIAETTIFSYGLGKNIRKIYSEKLQVQKDLNKANKALQEKLKLEIEKQHQSNLLLTESNQRQQLEMEVANLNNLVLRNQMNSHFIFNVLNSIKLFILENDYKNANLYLSKFAKFIRKILDGNFNDQNSIEEELEIVDLYLNIEKMRFSDQFEYSISVEDKVNTSNYFLPTMLLQPFVENALWHGLMKKNGEKRIQIDVFKTQTGCEIRIEDNGIGRKKAKKIKTSYKKENSLGLQIVQNRINLFNKDRGTKWQYFILDLKQGTRVVLMS